MSSILDNINPSATPNIRGLPISLERKGDEIQEEQEEEKEQEEEQEEEEPGKKIDIRLCFDEDHPEYKYNKECNQFLLKKELLEHEYLREHPEENDFLYPTLNDPNFNIKIAEKKEFNDTQYDGDIYEDIAKRADELSRADFELAPNQIFVKNFLSFQTPYNSLLLYGGLGSGKTCSAIGVCEEMRDYLKQIGMNKKIIIVASPNVQDNFKLQLFDERKLTLVDGIWTLRGCIGNKLIKEINPITQVKGMSKDKVISQINNIIKSYYLFIGYIEFANLIRTIQNKGVDTSMVEQADETKRTNKTGKTNMKQKKRMISNLKSFFNNTLIVIDEVHNIRTEESKYKQVADNLLFLVQSADNLRLLLLSATPMYNNYTEIIWLLNLMNINDRRATIQMQDVFEKNGDFKEGGKELLARKATGYVSFVKGGNPYTFPFRVYPAIFSPSHSFQTLAEKPLFQLNGKRIDDSLFNNRILDLYITKIGTIQAQGYKLILDYLMKHGGGVKMNFENMETFGYTLLQTPMEALNILYPLDSMMDGSGSGSPETLQIKEMTGSAGLSRFMDFENKDNKIGPFQYKRGVVPIFSPNEIGKYSSKIKHICDNVLNPPDSGVILIYSQYIEGGLIPVALALEELGITRYGGAGGKSLFEKEPVKSIGMKYAMITGDKRLSPHNDEEVNALTNEANSEGKQIKLILISRAGAEGLDFKFIRQVHILEPWYNMSRIEQIIGRAVRNFSHKDLPFEKRNVEIFMHATLLDYDLQQEAADVYLYRIAEYKAKQIGKVSRLLRETAIDCIINSEQGNLTQEIMMEELEKKGIAIKQVLSNGLVLNDFKVGDAPFSANCDYMADCSYKCISFGGETMSDLNKDTIRVREESYNESFILSNNDKIMQKIRQLMREQFFYKKKILIQKINFPKPFPLVQIYSALTQMIDNSTTEMITDKYGRSGYLINIGDYYLFQPSELSDPTISLFDRSVPIDGKHEKITLSIQPTAMATEKAINMKEKEDQVEQENSSINAPSASASAKLVPKLREPSFLKVLLNHYDTSIEYMDEPNKKPERGDEDWYKYCGITMRKLITNMNVSREDLIYFLVQHIVDSLLYEEKVELIHFIYSIDILQENSFEFYVKKYIEEQIIKVEDTIGLILYSKDTQKVIVLEDNQWKNATTEDFREINEAFHKKYIIIKNDLKKSLYDIVGYIDLENKYKYMVFKTIDLTAKRNSGARCDDSDKGKKIKILNMILYNEKGEDVYNKENTRGMVQAELCSLQEFLLRHYNQERKNNKMWFLYPELAKYLFSYTNAAK